MNFKQSNLKARNLLHKLGSETNPLTATTSSASVTANNIASRLVQLTKANVPGDQFKEVPKKIEDVETNPNCK